jgi:hypothetical protein
MIYPPAPGDQGALQRLRPLRRRVRRERPPSLPALRADLESAGGRLRDDPVEHRQPAPQARLDWRRRLVLCSACKCSQSATGLFVFDWFCTRSYDEHMTGKYAVPTGNVSMPYQVMLEGNFWPSISVYSKEHAGGNWYDVPYKIMVPHMWATLSFHTAIPSTGIGCHALGVDMLILPPLLSFSVKMTASPRAINRCRRGGPGRTCWCRWRCRRPPWPSPPPASRTCT